MANGDFLKDNSNVVGFYTATTATAALNNMVGDSGSGGTKGLVPAPASGDAAAGKFLKADATWAVPPGEGGGSGDSTYTAAYGSRPSASNDGDLFVPNNGFYLERDTGAAWVPWGPLFPFTAPIDGNYAWINQGGASVATTNGGIYLLGPAGAGENMRIRKKAAPSTPYTITAAFLPLQVSTNAPSVGLCFRQSSDGKLATLSLTSQASVNGRVLFSAKFTSATVFSATYTSVNFDPVSLLWLRIADNGTNRIGSFSNDGQNWIVLHSVGRTDFLTADEVGFFVNANNATFDVGGTLLSWKEA